MPNTDIALKALSLLDLTDLTDTCTPQAIDALCDKAVGPNGTVAAVCIWPRFVAQAKARLDGSGVRVATVVNFPAGGEKTLEVEAETRQALDDGADEIDMVMAYRAVIARRPGFAETQIVRIKETVGERAALKVILETGELKDAALIQSCSTIAVDAGADFIKTSTGKVAVNATPDAAEIMIKAIKDSGKPCGFKAAGGVKTVDDAARYLQIAADIMGPDWASATTFRFGASGLLNALNAAIEGGDVTTSAEGY